MSAPPTAGRCAVTLTTARGWPPGGASQPQRRTGLRPLLSVAVPKPAAAVAAVRGGSGAQTRLKPLSVRLLRSTPLKAGQQAGAVYGPRPTPLHWLRPARSRRLLARSRTRHLRPVRPRERGLPAEKLHLRASPARTRPTRVSGADKLHRRHGLSIKPGSGRLKGGVQTRQQIHTRG